MEVSILIVNYNSWFLLARAIESIHAFPPTDAKGEALAYEVIIVDNASTLNDDAEIDEVRELLRPDLDQLHFADQNGGYAVGVNLAYAQSSGRYLMVSNPDVIYREGCLTRLWRYLEEHSDVGVATPVTFADAGDEARLPTGILPRLSDLARHTLAAMSARASARYCRRRTSLYLPIWRSDRDLDLELFAGWGFLIPRRLVERIGFFDERYPLYYEDSDLSLRVRREGFRIVQVVDAQLVHLYNRSGCTAPELALQRRDLSERRYFRRWRGRWGGFFVDAVRAFRRTGLFTRLVAAAKPAPLLTAGRENGSPVIELEQPVSDFLIEIAYEPQFLLAAATFGSGTRWTPGLAFVEALAGPVFFRLVDLTDPRLPELGRWTFNPAESNS